MGSMFADCGWMSFPVAFLGVVALVSSIVGIVLAIVGQKAGALVGGIGAALAIAAGAGGLLGTAFGNQQVAVVLSGGDIDPSQKARIQAEGEVEAMQCTKLGTGVGVLPLLLGIGALVVARGRRESTRAAV